MKLTQAERRGVRNWLKSDRENQHWECPFTGGDELWPCKRLCYKIFPNLALKAANNPSDKCPCHAYPHNYVVRVARLLLARHGKVSERGRE